MDNKNKKSQINFTKKVTSVLVSALAGLTGVVTMTTATYSDDNFESGANQIKENGKVKPMPVLKLNMDNPDDSKFVASHQSHRSHSSHRSHYSHRSGAMFN